MRATVSSLALQALILAAACRPQDGPTFSAQDKAAVLAVDSTWLAGANAGRVEDLAAAYAPDATLLPPNAPPVKGRDAIRDFWGGFLNSYTVKVELLDAAADGRGDLAYVQGRYTLTTTPKAGAPALPPEEGKYLEVVKRQPDGRWRYLYDMYSSNAK